MTPEEVLDLQVKEFNKGNISFLMTLYENGACFASEPGQVVEDLKNIRQSLQSFIDMRSKLEAKVKRVFQANDLTLLITEWSINGTTFGKIYVLLKYRSNILKALFIIELDYFVFVHLEIDLHYYCGWTVYIKSKIFVFQFLFRNENRLSSNRVSHYIFIGSLPQYYTQAVYTALAQE